MIMPQRWTPPGPARWIAQLPGALLPVLLVLPACLLVLSMATGGGSNPRRLAHGHAVLGANGSPPGAPGTASLAPPSGVGIVPLDSSFHVTWTPSGDPAMAWQVVSVWDGATLQQAKVVGKTARAAQSNGLAPGHTYTVRVQTMDAAGGLSPAVDTVATTDPQSPMRNVAFFENFNESPGDLNANYFDVRTSHGGTLQPESIGPEKMLVFNNENHFHTQLIGGKERAELYIRPRVPFDFAGRTGVFQVEVDTAPVQHSDGKWFEIHLVRDIPWSSEEFGAGDGQGFPDSVEFSVRQSDDAAGIVNIPQITVNIGGVVTTYEGSVSQLTPANIRVPVVIKVSRNSAELLVNGVSVVSAGGFNLPFTRGYWMLAHRGWYGSRDTSVSPTILQLVHWDTIQFDGPPGSYNPVVRTYIQPGCPGVVHNEHEGIVGCPRIGLSPPNPLSVVNLAIPDDVTQARSARLLLNGAANADFLAAINGHLLTVPTKNCCFLNALNTVEFPADWLQQGANSVTLGYSGALTELPDLTQVEIEVVYNQPRVMAPAMAMPPMPMLSVSSMNFRLDRTATDPAVKTATTYLYSMGAGGPVPYTAQVISAETPWLTVSPAAGAAQSAALGGGVVPLTLAVDFTTIPVDADGQVGVVKILGGNMPLYVAVLAVNDGPTPPPHFLSSFGALNTTFNKAAIPDYHGPPCGANFSDVLWDNWADPYISYMACHGIVSGYSDGTFRPVNNTTRGQFAKIIVGGKGWAIDTRGGPHFRDVPPSHPFYAYIETAYRHNVLGGYSDGTFRPNNNLTRAQLAKITVLAQGWAIDTTGGPHFQDVPPADPLYSFVETAFNRGIISGYSDGTFHPGNNANRAQISKIIYNALTLP